MQHYATLSRAKIRDTFKAFCDARPVGGKFAHRATDMPAGSSPSMKWVNPPVAYMLQAGVPLLIEAGVTLPRLHGPAASAENSEQLASRRIALEAYPGLLARELIGNSSYKSDDKAKQTPERLIARKQLLQALTLGLTSQAHPCPARHLGGRCQWRQPRRGAVHGASCVGSNTTRSR
jgi:hypothetical protein